MTVAPLPQNLEEYTAAVFAELTKRGYTVGPARTEPHAKRPNSATVTMKTVAVAALVLLCGCAMTSGVMEAEDGTYLISAHAAPVRGGAAGASGVAYNDAQKFCEGKGQARHRPDCAGTRRLPGFNEFCLEHFRRLLLWRGIRCGQCKSPLQVRISETDDALPTARMTPRVGAL